MTDVSRTRFESSACSSGSGSTDSGSSGLVDDHALPSLSAQASLEGNSTVQDRKRTTVASSCGKVSTEIGCSFNDDGPKSRDRRSLPSGSTEGVLDHVTGVLRSISGSTHQLLRRQLNVTATSGYDTEQLIDDGDVNS